MSADLFSYYLPTAVVAYVLRTALRPRDPALADLSALFAFGYVVAGGIAASALAIVGPMLMYEYARAATDQAAVELTFAILTEAVFGAVWQFLDAYLLTMWWFGVGLLLRNDQPRLARLSLALAAVAVIGTAAGPVFTMVDVAPARYAVLGVFFVLWTAWSLWLIMLLRLRRPPLASRRVSPSFPQCGTTSRRPPSVPRDSHAGEPDAYDPRGARTLPRCDSSWSTAGGGAVAKWTISSSAIARLPPEAIFSFYLDPSTWGSWGHNTRGARARGPVVEGSIVDVKAGYGRVYPVLMRRVIPDRYVECEIRPPGMVVETGFSVEPVDGGTRIEHTITVSGAFSGITKLIRLDHLYTKLLEKEIAKLIALARAADRAPHAGAEEVRTT